MNPARHIIIFLLLICQTLFATPRFKTITSRDGLHSNVVSTMLQDSRGILWIGSWSGLCEYDGSSFKTVGDENLSIFDSSPVVNIIEQPGSNYIWASSSNGVCRVNVISGQTESYLLRSSFGSRSVSDEYVAVSSTGRIFCLVSGVGLYYFDEKTDSMNPVMIQTSGVTSAKLVFCIGSDTIIMDWGDGSLIKIKYSFDEYGQISIESEDFIVPKGEFTFGKLNGKRLFLAIKGRLNEYDVESGALVDIHDIDVRNIADATRIDNDRLYILYGRDRICEYDSKTGIMVFRPEISVSNILFIYHGYQDVLWVGVDNHGLIQYFDDRLPVKAVFDTPRIAANDFAEDEQGNILLATQGRGLILVRDGVKIQTVTTSSSGLLSDDISCLEQNGKFIFVAGSGGVDLCVFEKGEVSFVKNLFKDKFHVYSLAYDADDHTLWLGSLVNGVYKVCLNEADFSISGKTTIFNVDSMNPFSLPRNFVSYLTLDRFDNDYLYVATIGGYLCHLRKSDGHVDILSNETKQKFVTCMEYAPDSTLWLGGPGLSFIDRSGDRPKVKYIDAVPSISVHSIAITDENNIWMTTSKGVSRYSVAENKYYDVADRESLNNDEFLNHASYISRDGTIYLGASDGYDVVDTHSPDISKAASPLLVRDFLVRGEKRNIELLSDKIVLPYSDNFFEITFSEIDYIRMSKSIFFYKLEGFNENWVSGGTSQVAVFTNVSPGKYKFRVKSGSADSGSEASLNIIVRRPPYKSIAAIVFYSVFLCGLFILSYCLITRNKKKKRAEAEEKAETEHQNKIFTSKLDFFAGVAKEFGSSITLIQGYSDQLSDRFRLPSKAVDYVHTIHDSARKMQGLIEDILEFRNVGTGKYIPKYEKINVSSLLNMVIANYDTGHVISATISKYLSSHLVYLDSNALQKIFSNSIYSALRYTVPDDRISIELAHINDKGMTMEIRSKSDIIRNSGDLARMSERYASLETLEEDSNEGDSTVGLALIGNYVSSLGGEFSCSMDENGFVHIFMLIPYGDNTGEDEHDFHYDEDEDSLSIASQLVVVIDPDKEIRKILVDILDGEFMVMAASDSDNVLEVIKYNRPDLIVINVTQSTGYDISTILEHIKNNEITRYIPLVALSYTTGNASYIKGLPYSFEAVLDMPFSPKELRNTIRHVLRNRSDLKEYYNSALSDIVVIAGSAVTNQDKDFAIAALRIIQDNMSDTELSPAFVADQMHMSAVTLYRRIKTVFGTTPVDLIRSVRLRNAERLLKTTSINVSEIMFRSGFNNHSYFNKKFIEAYGMSPKKYRESQK